MLILGLGITYRISENIKDLKIWRTDHNLAKTENSSTVVLNDLLQGGMDHPDS